MQEKNPVLSSKDLFWPLSKKLLFSILDDQVSDVFVCELIWERLFYIKKNSFEDWISSKYTPLYWS